MEDSSDWPNPIFERNGKWYFWDETWTQYLGPFPYERYLAYGEFDSFLAGTVWHEGEDL